MRTDYIKRKDGENFEVPLNQVYKIACCDCGLVHNVAFVYKDGKLYMAAERNARATGQRRRHLKKIK